MHVRSTALLPVFLIVLAPLTSSAQHVPFERTFDVTSAVLDISTIRGTIEVVTGEAGRVRVRGTATVRLGLNVPANALELAKRVAAAPPVRREGDTIRLSPPPGEDERRAMTVRYQVQVPRNTVVRASSDSGATTISGVAAAVTVRTESSAIALHDLGSTADVTTQSGEVRGDDIAGAVSVRTGSSAITMRGLGAGLRARTQSGAVNAGFRGTGDVDIETSSSGIDLVGVHGGLIASTQSGRIRVSGAPAAPWQVSSGSGSFEIAFDRDARLNLDARSGSGSVRVEGITVSGSQSKGAATGAIGGGGPVVRASSRSGSIRVSAR